MRRICLRPRYIRFCLLRLYFLGSEARLGLVWLLSDIWNGLMAFPNLTAPAVFVQRGDFAGGIFKKAEVMGWQTS